MFLIRFLFAALAYFLLCVCLLSIAYRVSVPPSTLMLKRWLMGERVERSWVPIRLMSPNLIEGVIVAEDARYCQHRGVDWVELRRAVTEAAEESENPRGASTITMQTARNLFLWQGRSYIRKALEIPLAMLIDIVIGKRRTMEIYLNIAEWGEGIFGAEAASQHYFHKSVRYLSAGEAALLVASLPSPVRRNPAKPGAYTQKYAGKITRRLQADAAVVGCVR